MLAINHPLKRRLVDYRKVTRYLLSTTSKDSSKADFFIRFGFVPDGVVRLLDQLYEHPENNPIADQWRDEWGDHWNVVGPIIAPDGRRPIILTAWVYDGGSQVRLATAHPG